MQFLKNLLLSLLSDNNKVFKSCISLVTLRNSYVMMHGPMNIKLNYTYEYKIKLYQISKVINRICFSKIY